MSTPYIGEIRLFAFSRQPAGWLPCDGSLMSISENETLFVLLGTTYGGDGQSTFAVPDLRGRLPIHQGAGYDLSSRTLGQTGGVENVTLVPGQVPAHGHPFAATSVAADNATPGSTLALGALTGDTMYLASTTGATATAMSVQSTTPSGGNQPHNNLMPTLTAQFCIASEGLFPSQD